MIVAVISRVSLKEGEAAAPELRPAAEAPARAKDNLVRGIMTSIAGLGNIGDETGTSHTWVYVLDSAAADPVSFKDSRYGNLTDEGTKTRLVLLKPSTFMNAAVSSAY